jgi:hypothetical protein
LEEVRIKLDVGIKNDMRSAILKTHNLDDGTKGEARKEESAEMFIHASLPDLCLNLTPDVYNGLVNLNQVLKSESVE